MAVPEAADKRRFLSANGAAYDSLGASPQENRTTVISPERAFHPTAFGAPFQGLSRFRIDAWGDAPRLSFAAPLALKRLR